jgi:hypothetical protein
MEQSKQAKEAVEAVEAVGPRERRKCREVFESLNAAISGAGGWIVSVPGDRHVRFQTVKGSPIPDVLAEMGYVVRRVGTAERLIGSAVTNNIRNAKGDIVLTTVHPGPIEVEVYELRL